MLGFCHAGSYGEGGSLVFIGHPTSEVVAINIMHEVNV